MIKYQLAIHFGTMDGAKNDYLYMDDVASKLRQIGVTVKERDEGLE